jgi:hypothetical protein
MIGRAERNLPRGETVIRPGPDQRPVIDGKSNKTVLASLAPGGRDADPDTPEVKGTFGGLAPIPPRRPADLAADTGVTADVPLPPARPLALMAEAANAAPRMQLAEAPATPKPDAIAALISTKNTASASAARSGALPVLITEGPLDPKPNPAATAPTQALAYAATGHLPALRPAALSRAAANQDPPVKTVAAKSAMVPVPLDRTSLQSLTTNVAVSQTLSQSPLGLQVPGLRPAARIAENALSNKPSAGYVTSFGRVASNLETSSFTGPAVQPLTTRSNVMVAHQTETPN